MEKFSFKKLLVFQGVKTFSALYEALRVISSQSPTYGSCSTAFPVKKQINVVDSMQIELCFQEFSESNLIVTITREGRKYTSL